jgi:hypothetical protein
VPLLSSYHCPVSCLVLPCLVLSCLVSGPACRVAVSVSPVFVRPVGGSADVICGAWPNIVTQSARVLHIVWFRRLNCESAAANTCISAPFELGQSRFQFAVNLQWLRRIGRNSVRLAPRTLPYLSPKGTTPLCHTQQTWLQEREPRRSMPTTPCLR